MSEKYRLIKHNKNLAEIGNNEGLGLLFLVDEDYERKLRIIVGCLNEQQATINKLRKILAEAEDTIEVRCAEHYLKEYENIKHHIIGDEDE